MTPRPIPDPFSSCARCSLPVDDHTVAEWSTCMSDLHDHDLPFEVIPETVHDVEAVMVGSVAVKAGVHDSPLGAFPVLVFEFTDPSGPLPPIMLVLDATHMRSVRTLVGSAIDAACKAARRRRP